MMKHVMLYVNCHQNRAIQPILARDLLKVRMD